MNKRELNRATEKIIKESKQHRLFSDCQSRMKKACLDYLLTQGYYVKEIEELISSEDAIFGPILPIIKEYIKHIKFVSDGVRITDSRLEKMLNCIYKIEDKISEGKNNINNIKPQVDEINKTTLIYFFLFAAIITLPVLPISICLFFIFYLIYRKRKQIKEEIKSKAIRIIGRLPII